MKAKERFINAAFNKEVDRPPVWMMRQAGRYLPEYRAIKEAHSTKAMMQTPELACDITLQPVNILGVDAAILYSDILMIPDAMGMGLQFLPGEGPAFDFAVNDLDSLNQLKTENLNERLSYVFETIKLCLKKLPADYPLLGFAGAPFTVACYMVTGKSEKGFTSMKTFAWAQPQVYAELMKILTDATIAYLKEQIDAGVAAVQVFDTWASLLSPYDYATLVKPYTKRIFDELKSTYVPTIHYVKGGAHLLDQFDDLGCDVLGLDWRVKLDQIKKEKGTRFAFQGNFDPDFLLTTPEMIEERVRQMLSSLDNPQKGYICNLGHGILPNTPVKNALSFVKTAQKYFK